MKKRSVFTALAVLSTLAIPNVIMPHQTAHAAIAAGSVVVNEIMYNQASGSTVPEWVELYNTTSSSITLTGYKLTDNGVGSSSLTEGVYTLPTVTIPAGGYITVGNSYSTATYKWSGNFALSNSGDGVALFSDANGDNLAQSGEVIDSGFPELRQWRRRWWRRWRWYWHRQDPVGQRARRTSGQRGLGTDRCKLLVC